jgi:hypothetical protein
MTELSFPESPQEGDEYTAAGTTYRWDGEIWRKLQTAGVLQYTPAVEWTEDISGTISSALDALNARPRVFYVDYFANEMPVNNWITFDTTDGARETRNLSTMQGAYEILLNFPADGFPVYHVVGDSWTQVNSPDTDWYLNVNAIAEVIASENLWAFRGPLD